MDAIEAISLTKSFGENKSVDGATFSVGESEIFGFLGSNGAGKSTTMMILTTLLKPTSGTARVAGHDVAEQPARVRQNIGYVQQESAVDEYLTGRENLTLQARLNRIGRNAAGTRIDDILESVGLADRQHDAAVTYSGGMKKRLDIACGLLHRPKVLFLDEPTVGLDIQTRRRIWESIRQIRRDHGTAVFVSTHYMEEADTLCDRICIIDRGRIKTTGSPKRMKAMLGRETVQVGTDDSRSLVRALDGVAGIKSAFPDGDTLTIHVQDGAASMPDIIRAAEAAGVRIHSVSMTRPSLDDVFMEYTGHQIRDHSPEPRRRRRR